MLLQSHKADSNIDLNFFLEYDLHSQAAILFFFFSLLIEHDLHS